MATEQDVSTLNEDWFNQGKADAWAGRPKQPPEHDTQAASLYDLGYSEGEINQPPIESGPAANPSE